MGSEQRIALSVSRWAAWSPGLTDRPAWQAWAEGAATVIEPVAPDVKFVTPMMRRRLSHLSRMAFRVAADCLNGETDPVSYVFCSRYGEYHRSYGILKDLANGEPASAAAFSMSVHNTAASLYAIETKDTAQATALAGGEATLETAFLEAWCLLQDRAASRVLVVYHDEPLPEIYEGQATTVHNSAAFAMLLHLPDAMPEATELNLSWGTSTLRDPIRCQAQDPALRVLELLLKGGDPYILDTGRLVWAWSTNSEPA